MEGREKQRSKFPSRQKRFPSSLERGCSGVVSTYLHRKWPEVDPDVSKSVPASSQN